MGSGVCRGKIDSRLGRRVSVRIATLITAAAGLVLLLAQASNSASHPVGWYCSPTADEITIFTNFPVDAVATADGATPPTFTTPSGGALCVDTIETSHVNDPRAGTIGLQPAAGSLAGQGGPWTATAATGIWTAKPSNGTDTAVIQGTYACVDSNPATWTYSQADPRTTGFCRVMGRFAQADNTPPAVSFSAPAAGALVGGNVRFDVSASDGESGIEHLEAQTSPSGANTWTTRARGTDVLSWNTTNVADGTYDVRVVALDVAGNSTPSASISLTVDNTAPTITATCGTGTCSDGWYTTAVDVNAVASDAHLSGQLRYTTDGTNPFISPTALTFDAPIHLTKTTLLTFGIGDAVGNLATLQRPVKIDQTAPPAPSVHLGGGSQFAFVKTLRANAFTVYHRSAVAGQVQLVVPTTDDPESGVQSVDFPTSFVLTTWHASNVQPTAATYAWDASPGEPSTITIASRNAAGLIGPTSDISFAADDSAPTGTISCVPASCSNSAGAVTVTFNGSDAGSGLKEVRYTTDGTDPSATSGIVGGSVTVAAATPSIKFWAVDNVGNASITSAAVREAHSAAGTFDVNTTADTPDANAGNGTCADAAGACSLRAAVQEANALVAGSTINVPSGNYQLTAGVLTVANEMMINGAGARTTTVHGNPATSPDRVFFVTAAANAVTISGLTLTGGRATDAAGFFGGDVRNEGNLILREDTITGGSASSGGGVGNVGGALVIERSTITGNSALTGGGDSGGVQDWGDGTHHGVLTILNSTITGNQARLGGGIFVWNDAANTVTIVNSTIAGNQGVDRGIGGIGVTNGASVSVSNSIVSGNTGAGAPSNCGITGAGTISSVGHNLESRTDCGFTATGDLRSTDPQLGALQNNDGPTDTLLPSGSSPAIDAADDTACPSTDQRGTSRPQGAHCDIGAVEVVRTSLVVTNTNDSGTGSLRQAIQDANGRAGGDTITFAIPGGGVHTITPTSALPAITDPVTIDGYTQPGAQPDSVGPGSPTDAVLNVVLNGDSAGGGAGLELTGPGSTIRGLVINGGFLYGVEIDGGGATNNAVVGNYIGTTADGATAKGLGIYGVLIAGASANRVGGTAPADRNVISGTTGVSDGGGVGVGLALGAVRNTVVGNLIGLSANSTTYVPNATGLMILSTARGNVVGDGDKTHGNVISGNRVGVRVQQSGTTGNVISGNWIGITFILDDGQRIDSGNTFSNNVVANNGGAGVSVTGATHVTVRQNSIRNNGGVGIDLGGDGVTPNDAGDADLGANNLQNFPVITDAGANGTVTGTLNSAPSTDYTIEAFGSPVCDPSGNGEGQGYAGTATVTTDDAGNATFTIAASFGSAAAYATATAIGPAGTSEFSKCFRLSQTGSIVTVNSAADTDDGSCSAANCTLREAIDAANAHPGEDTIRFAILTGSQVIHVTSALPPLTGTTTLDGTSQPGWVAAPIITVDGSGVFADGLVVNGPNSVVRGLVVQGFARIGIHVFGGGSTVAGNYARVNGGDGVRVESTTGGTVGGAAALDRNVVGGNGGHGIFLFDSHSVAVRGNYSGTDASGAAAAGNTLDGIAVDGGGSNTITGNLVSGNHGQGISIFKINAPTQTSGNVVRANVSSANTGDGIRVYNGTNNAIGGSLDGQANTVRGNGAAGISVFVAASTGNTFSGNSIDTGNGTGPAIALHDGSNGGQPAPAITAADAAHVGGTLAGSAPSTAYTIEVFQSPAPLEGACVSEAVTFVGSATATTDASGAAVWSVPVAVDPGSVATATATSASGNTSQLSACVQTTISSALRATLTVDQSSTTAGAQSFALDSLPPQLFTQLATGDPASAPIPSAPIPSAAVGAAPIPSAPIPAAPIPSAPIPSAPIPSAPIPSAPIPSAPIPSAGLAGLPIPSAGITNPLDAILLSSLPNLDVTAMFAGTSIAGKLPQQYTLGDVYRTPSALAYLTAHYKAGDLNLGGTFLRGVRTLSYLLGGKTLNQINIGQDWCTALAGAGGSCAGVDVTKTTVIGLDIMGQLGSLDLGHLKVSDLTNGLNGTLVGNARIARIAFQQTTMAKIPVTSVPGITTCTSCATLGDAAAANAVVDIETTLQQLGTLLNNVTFSELVVAMTPRNALPWEQESFVGWQGFGGQAQKLQYHLDFDATCPISGLSVRARLPLGFVYVPGSTTLQVGSAAAAAAANPVLDPKSGATWSGLPTVACAAGQQEHLRLNFQGEPGYRLGLSPSSAIISANGDTTSVSGAPVFVNRNWTAALSRATEPEIAKDTIVLSHIDSAGGTNYFKFPEQGRGKLVTIYMKPPAGADFDLYVVRPSPASLLANPIPSAPIPSAPIPSAPIPSAPIPSADTSVNTTTDNPAPELLDDGPLPGGEVSVDSITRSPGGVEAVTFREAGGTGYDEIAIAGYNGAYSDQPFELRVQVQDPPSLPATCPIRAITPVSAGTLPVGVDKATQNLALVNVGRMNAMYGVSRTQTMLTDLQTVMASANGVVVPIDGDADVAAAAHAWDLAPCSIDAANSYVHAINVLVAKYRVTLNDVHSITLVGDDEQIPSARVADFVPTSSEFDNTNALAFLTQGGTVDTAAYAAAALGYVLTDDAYGAFHTRQLFGHEFFLPEVAVGRLVETPEEIDGQLQQYIHNSGTLSPTTGFVTGYDFMSDGSKAVDDGLAGRVGVTPSATNTLLQDTWGKGALQPFLNGATPTAKINSWNAHYDFHRLMPAVYTGPSDLLTTDLVPVAVSQRFNGNIFFTMGCHAGESLADTLFANATQTHDWAQAYSAGGAAVFIGNTGFGYGDTASVALSERLMSIFAGHLAFEGSVGEKLLQTKSEYFASMGVYGPYDEKSLEEATFYGLPFWQVNSPGESAPTPPVTQNDVAPGTGLKVAPLTITPHLTKVTDARGTFWKAGDGTVFVQGRTIQPLVTTDVTQPGAGYVAHGFFPSSLVTDDSNKDVDLYFAKPMIDLASHEPEPAVTNDVFPASPVKVAQADYLGSRHSTLDVIAGQSRPGSKPTLQNERLITSVGGVVTYAPASVTDYTSPVFAQTGSFVSGHNATIFATVSDNAPAGVIRVRAFFTDGGAWQFVDLAPVAGTPHLWEATNVAVNGDRIEVGFVAEDGSGNTGWMTGKGILVDSFTPSTAPPAPGITIRRPLDGGTYFAGQSTPSDYSCTSVVVVTTCAGTVANGAAIDTTSLGTKEFSVTATPVVGDPGQKTAHYNVVYDFGGFQAPISSTALNVVKAGGSVPVKFSLHGNFGLNIFATGYPLSGSIPCTGGTVDTPSTTDTAGSSTLTYDAGTDTYTYVWKTTKTWTGCRQLLVVLNDGVVHRANFQFK
jgi:CSLREA domain-containing protein